jgi:predicted dehydrogenase
LRLRVGVVGGGLVAQAMHLHYLAAHRDLFELVGLAEPSATVREALGARYAIAGLHADHRGLVDAGGLDAIVVCSPVGTHVAAVLDALAAGLHVFVEKPMCVTLADADSIVAARDRAERVVQVGTMKRFDPAYERMLEELPESAAELRYISVVVNDPEFAPYFAPGELVRGGDIPSAVIEATRRAEAEQVEAAVGSGAPDVVQAFSESFLGSLVHDVNLVHGLLERMGEPLPAEVVDGDWWNEGRAVSGAIRLSTGARWDSAWIQLLDTHEYRESVSFFFADSVRTLTFPSPWLKQYPTVYRRSERDGTANAVRIAEFYCESFSRELEHFHRCVTEGETCRTPPEQARLDIDVITRMYLVWRERKETAGWASSSTS